VAVILVLAEYGFEKRFIETSAWKLISDYTVIFTYLSVAFEVLNVSSNIVIFTRLICLNWYIHYVSSTNLGIIMCICYHQTYPSPRNRTFVAMFSNKVVTMPRTGEICATKLTYVQLPQSHLQHFLRCLLELDGQLENFNLTSCKIIMA
jgi:hypothetical protein